VSKYMIEGDLVSWLFSSSLSHLMRKPCRDWLLLTDWLLLGFDDCGIRVVDLQLYET
jgi:hypothetical protein